MNNWMQTDTEREDSAARANEGKALYCHRCPTCEHLHSDKHSPKSRCYLCPFHHRKPVVAPEPVKSTAPAGVCPACWGFGKSIPVRSGEPCAMCEGRKGKS